LGIVSVLRTVIWDSIDTSLKAQRFLLNQFELTLTNPCRGFPHRGFPHIAEDTHKWYVASRCRGTHGK